jgi:hypothetical protein
MAPLPPRAVVTAVRVAPSFAVPVIVTVPVNAGSSTIVGHPVNARLNVSNTADAIFTGITGRIDFLIIKKNSFVVFPAIYSQLHIV